MVVGPSLIDVVTNILRTVSTLLAELVRAVNSVVDVIYPAIMAYSVIVLIWAFGSKTIRKLKGWFR